MINPKSYDKFLADIGDLIPEARRLGLFRTAEKLHHALIEGRSERFEAQPNEIVVEFSLGPVREQPAKAVQPKP